MFSNCLKWPLWKDCLIPQKGLNPQVENSWLRESSKNSREYTLLNLFSTQRMPSTFLKSEALAGNGTMRKHDCKFWLKDLWKSWVASSWCRKQHVWSWPKLSGFWDPFEKVRKFYIFQNWSSRWGYKTEMHNKIIETIFNPLSPRDSDSVEVKVAFASWIAISGESVFFKKHYDGSYWLSTWLSLELPRRTPSLCSQVGLSIWLAEVVRLTLNVAGTIWRGGVPEWIKKGRQD